MVNRYNQRKKLTVSKDNNFLCHNPWCCKSVWFPASWVRRFCVCGREAKNPREQVGGNLPFHDSRLNTNLGFHIHLKIPWDKSVLLLQPPPSVWESIFLMLDTSSTLAQQEVLRTTYRKPEELEEMVPVHIMLCYTMVISSPIMKKISSNLHVQGVVSEKLYLRTLMMSQAIILHMNAAASVTTIVYVLVRSVVEKDFLLMSRKGWHLPQSLVPRSND